MANYQIFISYRRDGGEFLAGRISDRLKDKGYEVFYDVESMRSGFFNEQIYTAIDQCNDVLLILPPNSLDRCVDEEDWVRKEIEYSIKTGKNIIPVLMRGFSFPTDMPEGIKRISFCEGVIADSNYFEAMIDKIQKLLQTKYVPVEENNNSDMTDGVRFINKKMYPHALACFERIISNYISEPDAYFYAAVAKLAGKRPFMQSRSVISEIENYIQSAIAYGEKAVYYYFYAYVKYDYYHNKFLNTSPTYTELLQTAVQSGVTEGEIASLFDLLNVSKPNVF